MSYKYEDISKERLIAILRNRDRYILELVDQTDELISKIDSLRYEKETDQIINKIDNLFNKKLIEVLAK